MGQHYISSGKDECATVEAKRPVTHFPALTAPESSSGFDRNELRCSDAVPVCFPAKIAFSFCCADKNEKRRFPDSRRKMRIRQVHERQRQGSCESFISCAVTKHDLQRGLRVPALLLK